MSHQHRLTDDEIRAALRPAASPELTQRIAEDVAATIRMTPTSRGWPVQMGALPSGMTPARIAWLLVLVALLLAVALVVGSTFWRTRPLLAGNGFVAVGSDRSGIFLIDSTTGASRRLVAPWTNDPSGRTSRVDLMALAPDGSKLAYVSAPVTSWSIEIVSVPSGARLGRVTEEAGGIFPEWGVQWSRDGTQLVVAATAGGVPSVVGVDIASGRRYAIANPVSRAYDPALSPIDDRVAFVRSGASFTNDYRLVVTDLHGGNEVQVTALPEGATAAGAPDWSPDGTELVFTLERRDGSHALGRVAAGGGDVALLTPWRKEWVEGTWSPEGGRVLVTVSPQGGRTADIYENGDQRAEIDLMAADGSNRRTLSTRACANATWAPDGRAVIFEALGCEGADTDEIRLIDLDSGEERVLWATVPSVSGRLSLGWQALPRAP